jgi:phage shock protein A
MSLRSVTVSIRSRLDRVLCQIENHEAVAASALQDLHVTLARASSQLARLARSGERLRAELARARHESEQWRSRARECTDDARALDCLKRSRQCRDRGTELQRRIEEQQSLEQRLRRDLSDLEGRHREMLERHRALRARESRAQAYQLVNEGALMPSLEDVFERWETQVTEQEYIYVAEEDKLDRLEQEFEAEEERAALLQELASLRGER